MVNTWFKLINKSRAIEKSRYFISGWFRHFMLIVLRRGMRIIEINRHNLLLDIIKELASTSVLLLPLYIKTILWIVWARGWPHLWFSHFALFNNISARFWYENVFSTSFVQLHWHWVILTYSRCFLFEVDVDSNWLDVVKRIFFIKGKTKVALMVHVRCS